MNGYLTNGYGRDGYKGGRGIGYESTTVNSNGKDGLYQWEIQPAVMLNDTEKYPPGTNYNPADPGYDKYPHGADCDDKNPRGMGHNNRVHVTVGQKDPGKGQSDHPGGTCPVRLSTDTGGGEGYDSGMSSEDLDDVHAEHMREAANLLRAKVCMCVSMYMRSTWARRQTC